MSFWACDIFVWNSLAVPLQIWKKSQNVTGEILNIVNNHYGIKVDTGLEQEGRLEVLDPVITI